MVNGGGLHRYTLKYKYMAIADHPFKWNKTHRFNLSPSDGGPQHSTHDCLQPRKFRTLLIPVTCKYSLEIFHPCIRIIQSYCINSRPCDVQCVIHVFRFERMIFVCARSSMSPLQHPYPSLAKGSLGNRWQARVMHLQSVPWYNGITAGKPDWN